MNNIFANPQNYVAIGCVFYFLKRVINEIGVLTTELIPWKFSRIKLDMNGNLKKIKAISHYTDMVFFPENLNYQRVIGNSYNLYEPIPFLPKEGPCPHILEFLNHIFGEQIELGLDYITIIYWYPRQTLPILVLLSRERNTGKTTFLNFLNLIFGSNMVIVANSSLRDKFTSLWAAKLLVGVDETFLDKKEDSERLKALSTAKKATFEAKGKDATLIDSYLKFILCSNNISVPILIDTEETRYWIRDVPPLKQDIPNFLEILKAEIPAFLFYLLNRPLSVPQPVSRMWFDPKDIETEALVRVKAMSRPEAEVLLAEALLTKMDRLQLNELCFTIKDMKVFTLEEGIEVDHLHSILVKKWNLRPAPDNLTYTCYLTDTGERRTGRYYTIKRAELEKVVLTSKANKPAESTGTIKQQEIFSQNNDNHYEQE